MACAATAQAGAWNQEPSEGLAILSERYVTGREVLNAPELTNVNFEKFETRLYLELGLSDRVTLIGNAAYIALGYDAADRQLSYNGLDQLEFGLQYELKRKTDLAISTRLTYLKSGGAPNAVLNLQGDGDLLEFRGLIGQSRSFETYDIFYNAEAALLTTLSGRYDGWAGEVTFGIKPGPKWELMLQTSGEGQSSRGTDIFPIPGRRRIRSGVSAVRKISKRTYLQFGYETVWAGQNVVSESGPVIGTWFRY